MTFKRNHLKNLTKAFVFGLILLFSHTESKAQLTIDNSQNAAQLVQDVLVGNGVTISNIQFTGDTLQISKFDGTATNIGLQSGIILSSGYTDVAIGPNDESGATSGSINGPGNTDLSQLIGGQITNDAAVLEFDFIPMADSVSFRYVFASEEYNDYVCSDYNDAFGFFISGPGINGTYSNNADNIALVPGTTTPVAINTVNNGQPGSLYTPAGCPTGGLNNSQYFVDNSANSSATAVQFDGFTTVLTAKYAVQCGQKYHLKLAVADGSDGSFDSGVFLEARSFSTNAPFEFAITLPYTNNDSLFFEGCGTASISFSVKDTISQQIAYQVTQTGTAVEGIDYTPIADSISFGPGQETFIISFVALEDNTVDTVEFLNVNIFFKNSCNQNDTLVIPIKIADMYKISVDAGEDIFLCEPALTTLTAQGQGHPFSTYHYLWDNGGTNQTNQYNINSDSMIVLTAADTCGSILQSDSDTMYVKVADLYNTQIDSVAKGSSIGLSVSTGTNYQWSPNTGLTCSDCQSPQANPTETTQYIITRTEEHGCTLTDTLNLIVLETTFFVPNIFSPDNDGNNDVLKILGLGIKEIYFAVYNRWGELVFETKDINEGWDGTQNGKQVSSDSYLYRLEGTYFNGDPFFKKGNINIVR